ncbi:leucine-rich repeat-containing protein 34-like [Diabrotica virgifera virgifera]|uniref:Leucine-rich repeat-containing protein 34-like n=1 Tax=Diabrotica virgifera virgifera TaxID=50390 RepID=A0ABM5K0S5_DIAVI|nr:leucine-rich repeat-containing protein 34-like [Diabrotica virgifera virgifera]
MGDKLLNEDFLRLFCEKNSDGTMHLRLRGRELFQRFGHRLQAKHMKTIAYFMRKYNQIISVNFSYNDFGDKGMKILSKHFFNHRNNLLYFCAIQCDIHAEGMKHFSSAKHLNLITCEINGNKMGAEGARYIARLIERCPTLELMDIAETDQTLESIESILIVTEDSHLKALDISRVIPNSFYTRYNESTLADDLAVALKLNEYLVELHIQKLEFDGHDVEILLSGLVANKTLEVLNLGCNRIGDLGVELLAVWLKTRPALRVLNISANSIRNTGARALSMGMPYSKLRMLDISFNKLEDVGVTDILDTIKKYSQMRILFMWGNKFEQTACKRLDRMLKSAALDQDYVDVKVYMVDGKYEAAYYPMNTYKLNYYSVARHGYPDAIKIIRNKIYGPDVLPRKLLDIANMDRYPKVDESLGLYVKKEAVCDEDDDKHHNKE